MYKKKIQIILRNKLSFVLKELCDQFVLKSCFTQPNIIKHLPQQLNRQMSIFYLPYIEILFG